MGKELVISGNRHETKVAILEDDQLVEIYFQRANEYSLAGSIHKGRVTRVLPGMQSAFVDIGLERDAFLYVSDFFEDNEEYDRIVTAAEDKVARAEKEKEKVEAPPPVAIRTAAVAAPPVEAPLAQPPLNGVRSEEDLKDRRGRRSRRRRPRGRGFPESKYASDIGTSREEEPESRSEAAPAREEEFPVLPGESLAKYRGAPGNEAESSEGFAGAGSGPEHDRAEELEAEPEMAPPSVLEEERVESDAGSETEPPEAEVLALEPAASGEANPTSPLLEEAGDVTDEERQPAEGSELRPGEAAGANGEAGEEETADTGYPALSAEFEDESAEPESEPEQAAVQAEGEEAAAAEEGTAASEEVEPARMPVSLTATLRDHGYRYPHRVSRRMRRKTRGNFPESRGEERPDRRAEKPTEAPVEERERPDAQRTARAERRPEASISELLREGQEVLVQIAKEPLGQKGARITSHIALPGRYVVYMPTVEHLGVSRKIGSEEERLRLKKILQAHRSGIPGGFIVRTAGEGRPEAEIASDMQFLYNLWLDIRQKSEARRAPILIHHDLDLVQRILRDQISESFKTVWVDNEDIYESVLRFVQRFQPSHVGRVKLYTRDTPIFDAFNISAELEKALRPKVWLKSGGYIVINQTEALVAIDVNTGKFVGKSNRLEDTIVKTNTEAVKEIVRQVRLRDLGGIIVVDFIDMGERKNRQKVMQALEEAMRADRAPNKILQFNDFGLVAITRKRVKQSLERTLCSPCPYCEGSGYVKSVQTVIGEILQEAHKLARVVEGKDVSLRVHPEVAKVLKSSDNDYLEELEEVLGRPVLVTGDPMLQQENFDLI